MSKSCPHCGQTIPDAHGIICNDDSGIVMYDGKVSDPLTRAEYELASYLVKRFDKYCTYNQLVDWLYQLNPDPPDSALIITRTHISRARAKLRPIGLDIPTGYGGRGVKICIAAMSPHDLAGTLRQTTDEEQPHVARVLG